MAEEVVSISIRFPKKLVEDGKKIAQAERRSFNNLIVRLLEKECRGNILVAELDNDVEQYKF